jgi:hypothetical protein
MRLLRTITIAALVIVAACASTKTFTMAKVEDNLSRAFQKSQDISADMNSDFEQKKVLMEALRKSKPPKFKEVEADLKIKISAMEKQLSAAQKQAKIMMEARGNITALGYARKEIRADQPEYTRVEESVREFETAAVDFTSAASEYSRETNSLADLVAAKRLFFNFEVAEFHKKTQKAVDAARENARLMEREIHRSEEIRNSFEDEAAKVPVDQALEQMNTIYKDHANRIQELTNLLTEINNLTKGQSRIPSTSANWSEIQRVVNDTDRGAVTLNNLFKDFQQKVDQVRNVKDQR